MSAAQAQEGSWYIGAIMPLMFIDDSEAITNGSTTIFPPGSQQSVTTNHHAMVTSEHDTGYKIGGVLSYQLGAGLRLEGEIFLARAKVSKLTNTNNYGGREVHTARSTPRRRVGLS